MIKIITTDLIKQYNPCQSGLNNWINITKDKPVSLGKFLKMKGIPSKHKVWLLCRVMPKSIVETFALDCAFTAAAYAADAAAYTDAAAYAFTAAAYAAYAADAATADAAAYAATYAADAAAYAATADAADAADAAAYDTAMEEQVIAFKYLINNHNKG